MAVPTLAQPGVRFDTGISTGSTVSIHFDAMLGKLIVHCESGLPYALSLLSQQFADQVGIPLPF